MSVVLAGRVARSGAIGAGWVEVEGAAIAAAGEGEPPRAPDEAIEGILAPGLCDLQVNGAGGHEVSDGPAALDEIDRIQLAAGVTSYLPTLVSPDDETAERVLPELAERARDPSSPVRGAHVEGPFLSPRARRHAPARAGFARRPTGSRTGFARRRSAW